MITVRPAPREHYAWIAARAHIVASPGLRAIEAVDESGRIVGMVAYDGWTDTMANVHIALEHPAALRHLLRIGFRVPFLDLDRRVLIGWILSTNKASRRLASRLGFRELTRIRDGWSVGVDFILLELRREDCRYLKQDARRAA